MDYTVVAFAEDSTRWTPWSRFIKTARPDDWGGSDGRAPAGRYRIAAVDEVENFQWLDREFLQRLRPDATSLTLQLGQSAHGDTSKVVERDCSTLLVADRLPDFVRGSDARQQPPRDAARPAGTRGAAISGRVLGADGATPLRRAIVRLDSSALPRRLTVRARLQGRYAFPDLPAGRYTVSASKVGPSRAGTGQRRPFEAGRRIELGAAERLTRVDILLPASATITGMVDRRSGERVSQMWVMAARQAYRNGRGKPVTAEFVPSRTTSGSSGCRDRTRKYYIVTRQRDGQVDALPTRHSATERRCIPGYQHCDFHGGHHR